jgi:hypothetical protein
MHLSAKKLDPSTTAVFLIWPASKKLNTIRLTVTHGGNCGLTELKEEGDHQHRQECGFPMFFELFDSDLQ